MNSSVKATSRELTWVGMAQTVMAAWRSIVIIGGGVAILGAVVSLLAPTRWRSDATFMPQAKQSNGAIGGIAAQLGVDVPSSDPSQSPHFYVELLRSPHLLRRLAGRYPTRQDSVNLADALGIDAGDSARVSSDVASELLQRITATVAPRTGVVTATLTLRDPVLSQAVLHRALEQLDAFNVETRRSRAQAERRFTEQRSRELREELREAEDRLSSFLARNRITQYSPELTFQRDRLAREVALRQSVYATMVQAFETARIEQVRDTPVLTRLADASLPDRPLGPGPLKAAAQAGLLGLLLAALSVLIAPLVLPKRR